ncbi:hypothetical protein [uncultured Sphingomonas sp.]|uniref:hypothetical protein n=1 Tax=uncultured Sphingomonas sp. TaxID=158754 RepID=UPI0025FFF482|nr:hypothetical protein [uncultured Sphingomonas sp.]
MKGSKAQQRDKLGLDAHRNKRAVRRGKSLAGAGNETLRSRHRSAISGAKPKDIQVVRTPCFYEGQVCRAPLADLRSACPCPGEKAWRK